MKTQKTTRNMKHHFVWILSILMLSGLLVLDETSLAIEDTWTKKADMPTARSTPSAVALNGKIYVFGGCTNIIYTSTTAVSALPTVEEYDTGFVPPPPETTSVDAKGKLTTTWGEMKLSK